MSSVRCAALAAVFAGTALAAGLVQAQVYRVIGPDGKVTFTDRAPVEGKVAAPSAAAPAAASASLPAELRKAAGQFPVTLYASSDCAPCKEARAMLQKRGIPFSEKAIATEQDVAALQRLSGSNSLPFLTIGGQHLNGFSETEWSQYLDAAGYPKTSQLPPSYRQPPASPLVAVQQPSVAATEQASAPQAVPRTRPQTPVLPTENTESPNPAGIRF